MTERIDRAAGQPGVPGGAHTGMDARLRIISVRDRVRTPSGMGVAIATVDLDGIRRDLHATIFCDDGGPGIDKLAISFVRLRYQNDPNKWIGSACFWFSPERNAWNEGSPDVPPHRRRRGRASTIEIVGFHPPEERT